MKIPEMAWITDKLYIVYIFCLLLHIPGASWVLLLLWLDLCEGPSGVQYEWKTHHPHPPSHPGFTDKA